MLIIALMSKFSGQSPRKTCRRYGFLPRRSSVTNSTNRTANAMIKLPRTFIAWCSAALCALSLTGCIDSTGPILADAEPVFGQKLRLQFYGPVSYTHLRAHETDS